MSKPSDMLNYKDISYYIWRKGIAFTKDQNLNISSNNPKKPRVNYGVWFKDENTQIRWYTDPYFKGTSKSNKFTYNYKEIDSTDIRKKHYHRASIIPYIEVNKHFYWLLGSFVDFNFIKSDFGGKCEGNEKATDCSLREMAEETNNVLNNYLPKLLDNNNVTIYEGTNIMNPRSPQVAVFMVKLDMNNMDLMDKIQEEIVEAKKSKNSDNKEKEGSKNSDIDKKHITESFGKLGFYKEADVMRGYDKNDNEILTSVNLTDFVNYLKDRYYQYLKR